MTSLKKHIAGSGASAGRWVSCTAAQCTLTSAQYHTTAAELVQVQQYVEDKTGEKITGERLPLASVLEYKLLSDSTKKEIEVKVEARKEESLLKKANKTKQPGTMLNESREAAFSEYEKDKDKAKFYKAYLAAYPNLTKLSDPVIQKIFTHVEKTNASGGSISGSKTKGGSTLSLTKTAKMYQEFNDDPSTIRRKVQDANGQTPYTIAGRREEQKATKVAKTREELVRQIKNIKVTAKVEFITARGSMKNDIRDSFEQLKARGCTVEYTEDKGFGSTTFNDIKVIGPASVVSVWKTWLKNNQ